MAKKRKTISTVSVTLTRDIKSPAYQAGNTGDTKQVTKGIANAMIAGGFAKLTEKNQQTPAKGKDNNATQL